MARITLQPHPTHPAPAMQVLINDVDVSFEVFADMRLVAVGDEVGFQVTFAVSSLDLGNGNTIEVTDGIEQANRRVAALRKMQDDAKEQAKRLRAIEKVVLEDYRMDSRKGAGAAARNRKRG